jgi:hypothetical protein
MSKRRIPSGFFSQICLFQTFYSHIYPQNVQFFYMPIQIEFKQKYFNCLLLLRFQISLLPKIFPIKKTAAFCVFCGIRYSPDNLLSFDTNALYFVRPLYCIPFACTQGVIKRWLQSWMTNSALVFEPKCGGRGRVAGSQPVSTAVHMDLKLDILLTSSFAPFGFLSPNSFMSPLISSSLLSPYLSAPYPVMRIWIRNPVPF